MGLLKRYADFVVRFPWVIILISIVLAAVFTSVGFTTNDLPSFAQPTKGFEARGDIYGRSRALQSLPSKLSTIPNGGGNTPIQLKKRTVISSDGGPNNCQYPRPGDHRLQILYEPKDENGNMYSKEALKEICQVTETITNGYYNYQSCNKLISLGHYIAVFQNKSSCSDITEKDVKESMLVLRKCAPLYHSGNINDSYCPENDEPECCDKNFVYNTFHYLTEKTFLKTDKTEDQQLKLTMVFLEHLIEKNRKKLFQDKIEGMLGDLEGTHVKVAGVDFNIANDLFNEYIVSDMVFFGLAMGLILIIMMLYLRSFVITIATVFNVIFSIGSAYFFYHTVFRIAFFPFLNVLAGLVLIAVAADDVFVFVDIWENIVEQHPDKDLGETLHHTLHHGLLSISVTSFTTASAFLANMASEITAVKDFGIFACICIIMNFFYMSTWIPAVFIFTEKVTTFCTSKCCHSEHVACGPLSRCWDKFQKTMKTFSQKVFGHVFPLMVTKAWFLWILLLLGLGVGGIILSLVTPKLNLPTSDRFQFFAPSHPFSVFDQNRPKFTYLENTGWYDMTSAWGVMGEDNGNKFDPDGELEFKLDSTFNIADPNAQLWLYKHCENLKNQTFVAERDRSKMCLMTLFKGIVMGPCMVSSFDLSPCCNLHFPVNESTFKTCFPFLYQGAQSLGPALGLNVYNLLGRAFFEGTEIKAFAIEWDSAITWSADFEKADKFYKAASDFLTSDSATAPSSINKGFIGSGYRDLFFYDLQRALSSGTFVSCGISIACSFVVLLLTSLNILITFYVILTITFSIFVTVGILVLLQWELNILESIVITLAVGLCIDFAAHYGVGYRLANHHDTRSERVTFAFKMVGSAVFMAAFTTFVAGAALMPTRTLVYLQLGIFLMIVMTVCWVYSSFFLQSVLCVLGPKGNFAQIPTPKQGRCGASRKASVSFTGSMEGENSESNEEINDGFRDVELKPL